MKENRRDFVSMEETLRLLKLTNKKFTFQTQQLNNIPTHDFQTSNSEFIEKPRLRKKTRNMIDLDDQAEKIQEEKEEQQRKTINRNRAIKRIIQTSQQILQNNLRQIEQPITNEQQSSKTRLHIYLKQFNRLSQNIMKRQSDKHKEKMEKNQDEENKLEEIFRFSVKRSFKEKIWVKILPERIAQSNLEEVKNACIMKLCVLLHDTLRIYEDITENSQFQEIKLFQIMNVDYHIHPEILMVLTIANDKSKREKYMYLFFQTEQNQIKWDRALYCNFMQQNMKKRKEKLFLLDFPPKEDDNIKSDIREHKKDHKVYQVNPQKVITRIIEPDRQMTNMNEDKEFTHSRSRERKDDYFDGIGDMLTFTIKDSQAKNKELSSKSPEKMENSSSKNNLKVTESLMKPKGVFEKKHSYGMAESEQKEDGSGSKYHPKTYDEMYHENSPHVEILQTPQHQNTGKKKFISLEQSEEFSDKKNPEISTPHSQLINPETRRKIQLKKKYKNGNLLTKSKFFFDKQKKIYLLTDGIEYWDYETKNDSKTQRKVIKFQDIHEYKVKKQQSAIFIRYGKDKQITFTGNLETINDLAEWIDINKKIDSKTESKDLSQKIQ